MFVFRNIWRALFSWNTSWNTRFEIRLFALLPTKRAIGLFQKVPLEKMTFSVIFYQSLIYDINQITVKGLKKKSESYSSLLFIGNMFRPQG